MAVLLVCAAAAIYPATAVGRTAHCGTLQVYGNGYTVTASSEKTPEWCGTARIEVQIVLEGLREDNCYAEDGYAACAWAHGRVWIRATPNKGTPRYR